jgi:hypothetical protein
MSEPLTAEAFRDLVFERYGAERFLPVGEIRGSVTSHDTAWLETPDAAVEAWFKEQFGEALVPKDGKCVCGRDLMGLLGTFRWAIQHGIGNCSECGAGYQLYHYYGEHPNSHRLSVPVLVQIPVEAAAQSGAQR